MAWRRAGAPGATFLPAAVATCVLLAAWGPGGMQAAPDPWAVLGGEPFVPPGSGWVEEPWGYRHEDLVLPGGTGWKYPTVFSMEGYAGASRPAPNLYLRMDDQVLIAVRIEFGAGPRGDYASMHASIRGTECSGGNFQLYDRRHAWDGHHIIEWAAAEPWSNGRVGMYGGSYPGQTAYLVATTQPPSLKAVMPSLLHADIYRDIFMPGGIQNNLFPVFWTYAFGPHRVPYTSIEHGTIPADPICTQHQIMRYNPWDPPQVHEEPIWQALSPTDNDWYQAHAAQSYAHLIKIPYYQQHNWQDEQTGPRAVVLFHHIEPDPVTVRDRNCVEQTVVPKRFVLSSGSHGHGGFAGRERWAWFDVFLLDRCDVRGLLEHQVVNHFEALADGSASTVKTGAAWPFADTEWTRLHLREDRVLAFDAATGDEAPQAYVSGVSRHNWFYFAPPEAHGPPNDPALQSLPDAAVYRSAPLAADLVIAGPIRLDLNVSMTGLDTDLFVSLAEVWPDGNVSFLQRGLLKASHREWDPLRSYYTDDGFLYQPYRPHTNPQPVEPLAVTHLLVEVFPLGHVFRAGNEILLQVHTPPVVEGLWGYTPTQHHPGIVTVHTGAASPSSLVLPVVTPDHPAGPPPLDCQVPAGFPCVAPLLPSLPTGS